MPFTWSLALVVCLVDSTLPSAAQVPAESAAGPIARTVARDAVRLAAIEQPPAADRDWKRVRGLEPGTEIALTVRDLRWRNDTFSLPANPC